MGSNADLYDMEGTVKQEYMDIVKNMSHLELKNFSIGKYQKLVLSELTKSLPSIDGSKLKETTQCISNALEREVKVQLKSGARETVAFRKTLTLLSETVIADLETTLGPDPTQSPTDSEQFNCEETDDDSAETDVSDDDIDPNDSVTKLNQLASSVEEIPVIPKTAKSNNSNSDNQIICPELCKIKANSKKHYDMTRCSLCAVWFHDKCVGLGKNEPVGCALPVETFPGVYKMTSST